MKWLFLNIKCFVLVKLGKLRCSGWKVYPNGVRCCGCGDCRKRFPQIRERISGMVDESQINKGGV